MRPEIIERLLNINREFYQSFAESFRSKRGRLQPGVQRVLGKVPLESQVLDLGCAHGQLAVWLNERGFSGKYLGVDSSRALIEAVPNQLAPPQYTFQLVDLSDEAWPEKARGALSSGADVGSSESGGPPSFDWILAFATLHHLPGADLRSHLCAQNYELLSKGGRLALSVWDFISSARLRDRIIAWETVDIDESDVDQGDYLIEWREGGAGVRYVHHFSSEELNALATRAGFRVTEEFRSDGKNGQLGLYQIWETA